MKGKGQKAKIARLSQQVIKFGFSNGKLKTANGNQFLFFAFCLFVLTFCAPDAASAQPSEEIEIAPPPVKIISKEEKQQLEAEPNVKKYTQIALSLMEARLKTAESQTTENNYRDALNTLGGFEILLENTLGFLSKDAASDKVQNNLKRLEITLREQTGRLEVMRRAMPSRYGFYVQKLIKIVRAARTKAVEPLFGNTVVPQMQPQTKP